MAMISPTEGKKFERDPEEGNFPTGVYICELSRVEEVGPGAKFPNGNNRLVFEFTVSAGPHAGKKAIAFLGKTLHKSQDGKESNLVKWARMMGVANPEKGFDPDSLLGKPFQVMCEFTAGTAGQPGRAWARTAITTATATPTLPATPVAPAPQAGGLGANGMPAVVPTPDLNARWDYSDGTSRELNRTTAEVMHFFATSGCDPRKIRVKPAGAPVGNAKTADLWGFGVKSEEAPW